MQTEPGAAPGRGPVGGGGPGRRGEAEPSLEVGAPPRPHLLLAAPCVPLSHVAPRATQRPRPAQVQSARTGRCGGKQSAASCADRPGTATRPAPRRSHLLPGCGPSGERGSPPLSPCPPASPGLAPASPNTLPRPLPLPSAGRGSRSDPRAARRPSRLCLMETRRGWGLLLARCGLVKI